LFDYLVNLIIFQSILLISENLIGVRGNKDVLIRHSDLQMVMEVSINHHILDLQAGGIANP
jgi:hypothetical protein